ncbi:MAG: 2Fe-2S iron-sulfur cluster binding domain-containing protein [Methylocella sp.]
MSISAETRKLLLDGRIYDCRPGETVLDALLRQKVAVPNVCRHQVCLTCMMRSLGGAPPKASQTNISDNLRTQHFFLACGCHPERDMQIAIASETVAIQARAQVTGITRLNSFVSEIALQCEPPLHYRGGQFLTLFNDQNMGNRFPISSPSMGRLAGKVDIQVPRIAGGVFSEWVHTSLRIGDVLSACGATGELFYEIGDPRQTLLLAGWDRGLGALIGVMQDAFENDHAGTIYLFHGVEDKEHLYFVEELREVAIRFERFHYVPCVRTGTPDEACASGAIETNVERILPDLSGVKVYLCGPRNEVHALQRRAYLAGAAMKDIRTDVTHT